MTITRIRATDSTFPERLRTISDPPTQLFHIGSPLPELLARPCVAIVGSRKVTPYGRQVTQQLAGELAALGVVIISGLALGVDTLAHRAALEAGGRTIAVLPSSLDQLYPASNAQLGLQIAKQGGALVSEYAAVLPFAFKYSFVARNRLIAGLSQVVVVTEAALGSGSLHTADFGLDQGRDVMAVPGAITSPTSAGANNLLKIGATPVTSAQDVLHMLKLTIPATQAKVAQSDDPLEQTVLNLLQAGYRDGEELLQRSRLSVPQFNQTLTMLEINGQIRNLSANQWALY